MNTPNIWTDKTRCSGKPCVRNTRFTLAQLIVEISEGRTIKEIAVDFDLDENDIQGALEEVSNLFNKPWQIEANIKA